MISIRRRPHGFGRVSLHAAEDAEKFWFDLAPRAGIAWTPGGSNNHVARVAVGLFHSRISSDITLDTLRYDGVAVREFFVDRPTFFPEIPPDFDATLARPTVRLKDDILFAADGIGRGKL